MKTATADKVEAQTNQRKVEFGSWQSSPSYKTSQWQTDLWNTWSTEKLKQSPTPELYKKWKNIY